MLELVASTAFVWRCFSQPRSMERTGPVPDGHAMIGAGSSKSCSARRSCYPAQPPRMPEQLRAQLERAAGGVCGQRIRAGGRVALSYRRLLLRQDVSRAYFGPIPAVCGWTSRTLSGIQYAPQIPRDLLLGVFAEAHIWSSFTARGPRHHLVLSTVEWSRAGHDQGLGRTSGSSRKGPAASSCRSRRSIRSARRGVV